MDRNRVVAAVISVLAVCLILPAVLAGDTDNPTNFGDVKWQNATVQDMRIFEPYIGKFKSKTFRDEEKGKEFHYVVEYKWFDRGKTMVKFAVTTVVDGNETLNGEGFYGFDPFQKRLYTYGFFPSGVSGFGGVSEFNHGSHSRVTRIHSQGPDGVTLELRDEYEVVDEKTWKNRTSVSQSGSDWKVVYEDTFTRIAP